MNTSTKVWNWISRARWRLYFVILLLMVLPIGFFAFYVNHVLQRYTETEAAKESTQIARLSATLVEEHFRQSAAFLQAFTVRDSFRDAWRGRNLDDIAGHLEDAMALRPDFVFFSVYDVDGTMRAIYPPNGKLLNRNFAFRDWYKGVRRRWEPYISESYSTAVPPYELVVAIAVPIKDAQGKPIGILMAPYSLDILSKRLVEAKLDGAWAVSLVDQNGHLSARPGIDPMSPAVNLSRYEPVKRLREGQTGSGIFTRDGKAYLTRYEPLSRYAWGILVERPATFLEQSASAVEHRIWFLGLAFAVVGLLLGAFMASLYARLEMGTRFINLSIDMFCVAGLDGYFKDVNPAWTNNLGFSRDELLSKPCLEFIHPDDRAKTKSTIMKLASGTDITAFENRYVTKGGLYRWMLWNAVALLEEEIIYAVARDITERKQAEQTLREAEERYRKLFDNNPHPTWVYDRETLHFLAVNNAAVRKYGYTADEFLGMTIKDIRPSEDVPALVDAVGKVQDRTENVGIWRHRLKDGSEIDVEITAYPLTFADRSAEVVVAVDVSQQRRDASEKQQFLRKLTEANQQLELRNREVERATKMKSKFLASMSHELRTPLNAIVGFSGLLAEETAGQLNDKQKRFVGHIKNGADHLLQLINDILDLSKIEAGQLELRAEDFCVKDGLSEVLSTILPLALAKGIEITRSDETDCAVHADRVRLKQILYNLLSNAVKFTPTRGRITVEAARSGDLVHVAVSDTGIGIRPEDQQIIFDEFRQVNADDAHEGTGLGLAITKRLVEQQGGKIWVKSALGEGSCFTFTVPMGSVAKPHTEPRRVPVSTDSQSAKPLILIVDDEVPARELLASCLEPEGFRAAFAANAVDAMNQARQLQPDAITLDILMPGGHGFDTLLKLKSAPETADIPIIVVSILDQKTMGFALGAADYLVKPVNKATLLNSLHAHMKPRLRSDTTILIVDDDAKTRDLVDEILRSAGYRTRLVASGTAALDVLSSTSVNAVLLDLLMPEMDGFQVIRRMKEQPSQKDIPIFILTGKTLTGEEVTCLKRDTQALLHKDRLWRPELIAAIEKAVRRSKTASAGSHDV
jgi:PAS domain S-box-containing protein